MPVQPLPAGLLDAAVQVVAEGWWATHKDRVPRITQDEIDLFRFMFGDSAESATVCRTLTEACYGIYVASVAVLFVAANTPGEKIKYKHVPYMTAFLSAQRADALVHILNGLCWTFRLPGCDRIRRRKRQTQQPPLVRPGSRQPPPQPPSHRPQPLPAPDFRQRIVDNLYGAAADFAFMLRTVVSTSWGEQRVQYGDWHKPPWVMPERAHWYRGSVVDWLYGTWEQLRDYLTLLVPQMVSCADVRFLRFNPHYRSSPQDQHVMLYDGDSKILWDADEASTDDEFLYPLYMAQQAGLLPSDCVHYCR